MTMLLKSNVVDLYEEWYKLVIEKQWNVDQYSKWKVVVLSGHSAYMMLQYLLALIIITNSYNTYMYR